MKKSIFVLAVAALVFSCKKEDKPKIVGKNAQGQELIVNAQGDTVVYNPEANTKNTEVKKEVRETAFEKNAEGEYVFQFNLEKGKTYPFSITTKANVSQSDGKNSQKVSQESVTALDYTVAEVKDSTYLMDVKFTRFQEQADGPSGKISYDTSAEKPTNKGAAQQWEFNKAIVGKTFSMEITKDGKVLDVTKLLPVRNAVKEALKSSLSKEELAALDNILNQTLSVEAMQSMFEESTSYYPKKAVKIDETWSKKEGNDKASSTMDYTFRGFNDGMADIAIKGTSKGSDSQSNEQGVKLFRSLEGNVDGTVKIDEKSGWISSAKIEKKEVVRMTQQYQGQKMNFSSTTNSTTTIN
ncbi:hypothetical protein KRX57_06330 [Weeksellaceae bacterium TAE3-ERU29]|nr:hypothetical protein [Weeksellaceae bacterium TAE3-ERU29]